MAFLLARAPVHVLWGLRVAASSGRHGSRTGIAETRAGFQRRQDGVADEPGSLNIGQLAQLALVAIGAAALWRWRAMVPFLYLVLLAEQIVRRLAALASAVARTEAAAVGMWINLALLALLFAGLVLSLWSRPSAARPSPAA